MSFDADILTSLTHLYIHNKYTQNTHTYYVNKNIYFGCDLIAINRLTALIKINKIK